MEGCIGHRSKRTRVEHTGSRELKRQSEFEAQFPEQHDCQPSAREIVRQSCHISSISRNHILSLLAIVFTKADRIIHQSFI